MKKPVKAVMVSLALISPLASFAQTNQQSLTREQVRADVIRVEKAGYNPLAWADFPEGEMLAAEFRVADRRARAAEAAGYGSGWSRSSQSGDIAR